MNALVSVIIPIYNAERYLAEAIDSILVQDYHPLEIIVVDDGSTDDSAAIAQQFGDAIQYFYQESSGIAATRNRGILQAKGEYFSFLDADDRWSENKLYSQIAAFERNPVLDIVFGQVQQFFSPDLDEKLRQRLLCPEQVMPGNLPGSMLAKRAAFDRVGLFSTEWQIGEFIDWYLRATELDLQMEMLPEVVLWRRIHNANQGIVRRHLIKSYTYILKASLDRRRNCQKEEYTHG